MVIVVVVLSVLLVALGVCVYNLDVRLRLAEERLELLRIAAVSHRHDAESGEPS